MFSEVKWWERLPHFSTIVLCWTRTCEVMLCAVMTDSVVIHFVKKRCIHWSKYALKVCEFCVFCRNGMADFGGEVMAEVLAQRALEKPVIPLIPITNSNQYRHAEHDRDYKSKVCVRTQQPKEQHAHNMTASSVPSLCRPVVCPFVLPRSLAKRQVAI